MSIQYTDGRDIEVRILETIEKTRQDGKSLGSSLAVAPETYSEWAFRYHLSHERAQLLRHFNFSGLSVLEIGAGMGAVSRFLAEEASSLFVVEGTQQRFCSLRARLADLKNWDGSVVNFQDFESPQKFDVVCVIGVMEYSELYFKLGEKDSRTPFEAFLDKALGLLKEDGSLVLAIENKLGLKYWGGAAEDHSGRIFDGICGYPSQPSAKTLSRQELLNLFSSRGLSQIDEYYPFPDYKVPSAVLSRELVLKDPHLSCELALTKPFENYGNPRFYSFADDLALHSVTDAGLLPEFANSFLFVGSLKKESAIRKHLLSRTLALSEFGWHYSGLRAELALTRFSGALPNAFQNQIEVEKVSRSGLKERLIKSEGLNVRWKALAKEPAKRGEKLSTLLLRDAYFEKWDSFFNRFTAFLQWSFENWKDPNGSTDLRGGALDAVCTNCICGTEGTSYQLFDLEWEAESLIPKDWFVLRNVLVLGKFWAFFQPTRGFETFQGLYLQLCERLGLVARYELAAALEGEFQALTSGQGTPDSHFTSVRQHFENPILVPNFLREPALEVGMKGERHHLQGLIKGLHAENHEVHTRLGAALAENAQLHARNGRNEFLLNSLPHRLAERLNQVLSRFKLIQRFVKLALKPFS